MTRQQRFYLGLAAYLLVLWVLWPTIFVYPLKIFVVFLHELSHAIAGAATGGEVDRITLDWREGGATWVRGGNSFIMLSAGYLGSLLWGLALLFVARSRPRWARPVIRALGVLTLLVTFVYVRSSFGIVFGLFAGFTFLIAGRQLSVHAAALTLAALGVTSTLYALLDIRSDIIAQPGAPSDAAMLAQMTGIPTLAWGVLWGGLGLVACWLMLRKIA